MKVKIQEVWYDIDDDKISMLHDIALVLQNVKWEKESKQYYVNHLKKFRSKKI